MAQNDEERESYQVLCRRLMVLCRQHRSHRRYRHWSEARKLNRIRYDAIVWSWCQHHTNSRHTEDKLQHAINHTEDRLDEEQHALTVHWLLLIQHPLFASLSPLARLVLHAVYDLSRHEGPTVLLSTRAAQGWIVHTHDRLLHHSTVGRIYDQLERTGLLTITDRGTPGLLPIPAQDDDREPHDGVGRGTRLTLNLPTLPPHHASAEAERQAIEQANNDAVELNLRTKYGHLDPTSPTYRHYLGYLDHQDDLSISRGERASRLHTVMGRWCMGEMDIWRSVIAKRVWTRKQEKSVRKIDQARQARQLLRVTPAAPRRPPSRPSASRGPSLRTVIVAVHPPALLEVSVSYEPLEIHSDPPRAGLRRVPFKRLRPRNAPKRSSGPP